MDSLAQRRFGVVNFLFHAVTVNLVSRRGNDFSLYISRWFPRLSLTPGFSPVALGRDDLSRFNGFPHRAKAAEAARLAFGQSSPG